MRIGQWNQGVTRWIISDGSGSNKLCRAWDEVLQWCKDYGLRIDRQETRYSRNGDMTIYVYVKPNNQ